MRERPFKRYVAKRDKVSAKDLNRRAKGLEKLLRSSPTNAIVDSTGITTRRDIGVNTTTDEGDLSRTLWATCIASLKWATAINVGIYEYTFRLNTSVYISWVDETEYVEGDLRTYNDYLYECETDHTSDEASGKKPTGTESDNAFWSWKNTEIVPKGIAMEGSYTEVLDFRYWVRWFAIDDVVPLVKRGSVYYIWQTLTPTAYIERNSSGEITQIKSSLKWNEIEKRLMCVFS